MKKKSGCVVIIVLALSGLPAFALPSLQNGDFSEPDLAGWTVISEPVISLSGVAFFPQDIEEEGDFTSALGQAFTFPTGALTLSFDIVMTTMGGHETDSFTASLYDNSTDLNPLVSIGSDIDEFFYIDSRYQDDPTDPDFMKTVGTFDGTTVTLDASGFQDQDAYLLFNLYSEDEQLVTTLELDNVNISIIPEPATLLLLGLGGLFLRKHRK